MTESQKAQRPAGTGRSGQTEQQAPANNRLVALWRLVGAATRTPDLSRGDVAVLWAILDRIGTDGTAWPGYGRIAKDTGLHRATVARSVVNLVQTGFLHRESGGPGKSNRYRLGVRAHAPSSVDATSSTDATGVYAPTRLGVYAPTRPEPASLNLPKEPTQSTRAKRQPEVDVPAWLPADAWQAWKDHRKQVGRKFTEQAQKLAIRKLDDLKAEGHDPRKLIELAIESGWSSFNPRESTKAMQAGRIERDDRDEAEIDAENRRQLARFGMGVTA